MLRTLTRLAACSAVGLLLASDPAAIAAASGSDSTAPRPVSPGAPDRTLTVADPCPTFSWSAADAATRWQLAVYRIRHAGAAAGGGREESFVPNLEVDVPGGARSWTPSLDRCPSAGGSYIWFVRGLDEEGRGGEWSLGSRFEVPAPSDPITLALLLGRAASLRGQSSAAGRKLLADAALAATPTVAVDGLLEVGDFLSALDSASMGRIETDATVVLSGALGTIRTMRYLLNFSDTNGLQPGATLLGNGIAQIALGYHLSLLAPDQSSFADLSTGSIDTDWVELGGAIVTARSAWYPPGLDGGGSGYTNIPSILQVAIDKQGAICVNRPVRAVRLAETDTDQIGVQLLCGGG